jgi:hypothetical protein
MMVGHQIFLAAVTVSELRYGALVAQWGETAPVRLGGSRLYGLPTSGRLAA